MKTKKFINSLLCAVSALSLTVCMADMPVTSAETVDFEKMESQLVSLINNQRTEVGLEPLEVIPYLSGAAGKRAKESFIEFSHERPDGSTFADIIDNSFKYHTMHENLFKSENASAEEALTAWLSSPNHASVLLSEDADSIGVGLAYNENYEECWHWAVLIGDCNGVTDNITVIPPDDKPVEIPDDVELSETENQLLTLVNEERSKKGLEPLKVNSHLCGVARQRAKESFIEYSHTRPDGSNFTDLIDGNIFNWKITYENLFKSENESAEEAVVAWKNSSPQKEALLDSDAEYVGIGLFYNEDYKECWHWSMIIAESYESEELPAGDANGDGRLSVSDAVMIMQVLTNPADYTLTPECAEAADVVNKGDGLTSMDALAVQMIDINILSAEDLPVTSEMLESMLK